MAHGQWVTMAGEASASGVWSDEEGSDGQYLVRYLPEISFGFPLDGTLSVDASMAANLWGYRGPTSTTDVPTRYKHEATTDAKTYRGWIRVSAPQFEVRAGLQKISFGSSALFRPLMWFDRLDPRDPLQLTEGVWAVLGRAYLPGNVTAWGWVVRGEEERKGWEVIPSVHGAEEAGGRLQLPVGPGEAAFTYHHRRFDLNALGIFPPGGFSGSGDEDRFGLDGKWDLVVGVWAEAVLIRQRSNALVDEWSHALSLGTDYTFGLGNGLTVLGEYMLKENPAFLSQEPPGTTPPGGSPAPAPMSGPRRLELTSATANYPVGVLDRVSVAVYRDWEGSKWYRLLEWRRTYDRWRFHLLAFWNPKGATFFPGSSTVQGANSGAMTGRGAQLIIVFNH